MENYWRIILFCLLSFSGSGQFHLPLGTMTTLGEEEPPAQEPGTPMYISMGGTGTETGFDWIDQEGGFGNVVGTHIADITDSLGNATGISLEISQSSGSGQNSTSATGDTAVMPVWAWHSAWRVETGSTIIFKYAGLEASSDYIIWYTNTGPGFVSDNVTWLIQGVEYIFSGAQQNRSAYNSDTITASAAGEIEFRISATASTYIPWMRVQSLTGGSGGGDPDPEPTGSFSLSSSTVNENYPAGTYIGTLSGSGGYEIDYTDDATDCWFFQLKGDSLLSRMSFNHDLFIGSNLSSSMPIVKILDSAGNVETFTITINPASGKWDQNGYADQEMVDFYEDLGDSSLRVGDYVVFEASNNSGWLNIDPNLNYPNQIKLMSSYYDEIFINFANAHGNNTKQPVIVTNWLGQVEYRKQLYMNNCNSCRLTGQYDPVKKTGNKYFDATIHDAWKHRQFGIYRDVKSLEPSFHAIAVRGYGMTKIEIDHTELSGGHYDGINFKDDNACECDKDSLDLNGYTFPQDCPPCPVVDSSYVHDNYIHDLNNEGLYMGNTKTVGGVKPNGSYFGPQQFFTNTVVENNLFIRCGGEGYQFQRGIGNNLFWYNVIWSGLVWRDPFQNNQFGNEQSAWANGGNVHKNNIFMGSRGEHASLVKPRTGDLYGENTSYTTDTNRIENSLYYNVNVAWYMNGSGVAEFPPTVIDGIYIGEVGKTYQIIKHTYDPDAPRTGITIENWPAYMRIGDLYHDNTIATAFSDWEGRSAASITEQVIPAPDFENALGSDTGSFVMDSVHRWDQWKDSIWVSTAGEHEADYNVGDSSVYKPGHVVQHFTPSPSRWNASATPVRLYYCIQEHISFDIEPGVTPGWELYWKLLTWETPEGIITFIPPDDFDLEAGSTYDGMGLKD